MKAGPEKQTPSAIEYEGVKPQGPRQFTLWLALLVASYLIAGLVFRDSAMLQGWYKYPALGLGLALLLLSAIDLDRLLLPDILTLPLIVSGLAYAGACHIGWPSALSGAAIGYGLIAALAWFWRYRFGREGIGLGDAKLLSAAGAWCGPTALPLILTLASFTGLFLIGLHSLRGAGSERNLVLPFGPLIGLSFWIVWLSDYAPFS